jgi:hypothetical protein
MTDSQVDVELLGTSMRTVETIHERSRGIKKLQDACWNFYRIAESYYSKQRRKKSHSQADGEAASSKIGDTAVQYVTAPRQDDLGLDISNLNYMDFSMQQDWDQMLDGWELGLGAESARQMTSYFEQMSPGAGFRGSMG